MRGKATRKICVCENVGITPAYAGKSRCKNTRLCGGQDHPRLCGEKHFQNSSILLRVGSPPPMRGKVFLAPLVLSVSRITPAYAGKRSNCWKRLIFRWDHPRLCGEKLFPPFLRRCPDGSPPPMRGKGWKIYEKVTQYRITPAYAGKSERDSGKSD